MKSAERESVWTYRTVVCCGTWGMWSSIKCMQRTVLFKQRHRLGQGSTGRHHTTRRKQVVQQKSLDSIAPSAAGSEAAGAAAAVVATEVAAAVAAVRNLPYGAWAGLGSPAKRRSQGTQPLTNPEQGDHITGRRAPNASRGRGTLRDAEKLVHAKAAFRNVLHLGSAMQIKTFPKLLPLHVMLSASHLHPSCPFFLPLAVLLKRKLIIYWINAEQLFFLSGSITKS